MNDDYTGRMKMLHTRLTVTLQSFIWAGRGKEKKEDVMKSACFELISVLLES